MIVSFSIGALVQWVARLLLSYDFERKAKWVGALFGGFALTAITYFIFMKGIGGTNFAKQSFDVIGGETIQSYLEHNVLSIVAVSFIFWSLLSFALINITKTNIYKLVILIGTFALALAFAGNDLVNFIGVAIAGKQAYMHWMDAGGDLSLKMDFLSEKQPTETLLLFGAGVIMVVTLWFSSKAKKVTETEVGLSRQDDGDQNNGSNALSGSIASALRLLPNVNPYNVNGSDRKSVV